MLFVFFSFKLSTHYLELGIVNLIPLLSLMHYFFLPPAKKKEVKKETKLGMTFKKDDNFGEWYSEVCHSCALTHCLFINSLVV
jgi:hypothetical protein